MKIIIAIDSFKGNIDGLKAASAVAGGIRRIYPDTELITIPIADSGIGIMQALGVSFRDKDGSEPGVDGDQLGFLRKYRCVKTGQASCVLRNHRRL